MSVAVGMDFFERQETARRKTSILIVYYVLAVVFIMLGVYLAFAGTLLVAQTKEGDAFLFSQLWNPELFAWVIGCTFVIVVGGSLFKISQLGSGGKAVAEMLGGSLVNSNTRDSHERKILNVVEEMAIASGTPVPPVYMMAGEQGINAFAAGFTPADAVIGVTRGCVENLSRDELQGVIAHEFSHILNGDMRLNIRLIGVLHGILIIGMMGFWMFRISLYSGHSRSRNEKGNKLPFVLLGLIIMVIGYVGVFFGKLIKSAVSRQREYLADASAVQFTRNPDGIGGALKKIGGFKRGSCLAASNAEEASHFFFANGLTSSFMNLMSTHPPLDERIRRIDPSFTHEEGSSSGATKASAGVAGLSGFAANAVKDFRVDPDDVVASVGAPMAEHLDYASGLIASLSDRLLESVREPFGARAVVYALLLDANSDVRDIQISSLNENADVAVCDETMKIIPLLEGLDNRLFLPLVDLAMAPLKSLSLNQYQSFCDNVQRLVEADENVDLFEFALQRMIVRHLEPTFKKIRPPSIKYHNVDSISIECGKLLSCLAYWGADDVASAEAAFKKGLQVLISGSEFTLDPLAECGLSAVDMVLSSLSLASPMVKKLIIKASVACVASDGKVTIEEAELLRAIADSLGCPVPPFLAG
ncbi:MAG: M48 family metallopeptidase [Kiritimatiellae bacterium]|nr:M48 family metallopeptidase [Kiritimatiellia bacterium]